MIYYERCAFILKAVALGGRADVSSRTRLDTWAGRALSVDSVREASDQRLAKYLGSFLPVPGVCRVSPPEENATRYVART